MQKIYLTTISTQNNGQVVFHVYYKLASSADEAIGIAIREENLIGVDCASADPVPPEIAPFNSEWEATSNNQIIVFKTEAVNGNPDFSRELKALLLKYGLNNVAKNIDVEDG